VQKSILIIAVLVFLAFRGLFNLFLCTGESNKKMTAGACGNVWGRAIGGGFEKA
jgi:hypothetical protein